MNAKTEKRTRLEQMIMGQPPDRPPVALWRHWPGDDQDAAALAAAHLKWQRDYDWDLVKVSPASSFAIRDWGVQDEWQGHIEGTRTYTRRAVVEVEDWLRLRPLSPDQGMLAVQLEALRLVKAGLSPGTPMLATIFSPLAQARNLAGDVRLLAHLRRQPDAVQQGLQTITETTLRYLEAASATGIDGIFYAIQHARYTHLSPAEYARYGRPYDVQLLAATSDLWLNMIHVHGEETFLEAVADYPVQLINWHDRESGIDLRTGLALFTAAACGGISRWTLHQEAPDAALAEARDAWQQTAGRRWLLGAGCVIMTTTPTRNIRALREFVERLRKTVSGGEAPGLGQSLSRLCYLN